MSNSQPFFRITVLQTAHSFQQFSQGSSTLDIVFKVVKFKDIYQFIEKMMVRVDEVLATRKVVLLNVLVHRVQVIFHDATTGHCGARAATAMSLSLSVGLYIVVIRRANKSLAD